MRNGRAVTESAEMKNNQKEDRKGKAKHMEGKKDAGARKGMTKQHKKNRKWKKRKRGQRTKADNETLDKEKERKI